MTNERDTKRQEHEALRKKRLEEFMAGFTIITTKLKEMYQVCYYQIVQNSEERICDV